MINELFIDGRKVDIGSNAEISLTIRSNIYSDISKITGNNSATIQLPLTGNNREILQCCFAAGTQSTFPYSAHSAVLIRDGVTIVDGATAVLMKTTTTTAEIALTWGVPNTITKFIDKGAYISDLTDNSRTFWWKESNQRQPFANYGFSNSETSVSFHPVLSVREILTRIQQENGVTFNFDKKPWEDADIVLPIIKRDALEQSTTFGISTGCRSVAINANGLLTTSTQLLSQNYLIAVEWSGLSGSLTNIDWWVKPDGSSNRVVFANKNNNTKMRLNGRLVICIDSDSTKQMKGLNDPAKYSGGLYCFESYAKILKGEYMNARKPDAIYSIMQNGHPNVYMEWVYNDEEITIENTRLMCFALKERHEVAGGWNYGPFPRLSNTYTPDTALVAKTTADNVALLDDYPLFPNLPKIKQIDFIKAIMQMYGLFAFLDSDGNIAFASVRTLIENKANAQDWSAYLLANTEGIPNATEFVVGDECKRNIVKYKDSDAWPEWNSEYVIPNESLQDERDAITLPFTPYLNRTTANLPVYSYNDDGTLEYNGDDTAYICRREQDDNGNYALTNFGCRWPELMANYTEYVNVLTHAKVVTENFILSPFVLRNVDLRVPVYLRQYGQHYAIVEIKTKANNMAEVKLIKL